MIARIYAWFLRTFGFAERRCSYCKKLMGWKYGPAFRIGYYGKDPLLARFVFLTTHGICRPCKAIHFSEPSADPRTVESSPERPRRRQHTSRKNLRRCTGGWSGAVATH